MCDLERRGIVMLLPDRDAATVEAWLADHPGIEIVARDHLSKADTVIVAAIEAGIPLLVEARRLMERFHAMIRKTIAGDPDPRIVEASASLIALAAPEGLI